jgi:hypothetical protein
LFLCGLLIECCYDLSFYIHHSSFQSNLDLVVADWLHPNLIEKIRYGRVDSTFCRLPP